MRKGRPCRKEVYSELISARRSRPPSPIYTKRRHRITIPAAMALTANMTSGLRVRLALNETHFLDFKKMVQKTFCNFAGLVASLFAISEQRNESKQVNIECARFNLSEFLFLLNFQMHWYTFIWFRASTGIHWGNMYATSKICSELSASWKYKERMLFC